MSLAFTSSICSILQPRRTTGRTCSRSITCSATDVKDRTGIRKTVAFGVWGLLNTYAFLVAPNKVGTSTDSLWAILKNPIMPEVNGIVLMIFLLMPVWSIFYAATLLPASKDQKPSPLPFLGASFGVGAFAILPYIARREYQTKPETSFMKTFKGICEKRWFQISTIIYTFYAVAVGLGLFDSRRDIIDYIFVARCIDYSLLFKRDLFVHVMSLDFLTLWLFSIDPLIEDMRRRRLFSGKLQDIFSVITIMVIPVVGASFYLLWRPLADTFPTSAQNKSSDDTE
eukprot:Plantae.Rhodophyta-Purpureofilum_apyrenoidigerum.ctg2638.p1 GENE.Plantae.Rhodophyta-Purpureofilum_apyrenoidigerum.ctg2638~~Plantae.Rhodophyta-Purpureofilum_apyrenoidigerum.ctg2638.p1  ORF type:complete len:284 (+),score=23.08 Plantae.Rhodophyta-Purpureofilum_apyrenoidigerum.ctg2638:1296-2147(+)